MMESEALAKARMVVHNRYGADLESKASDAFCIVHGLPTVATEAFFESAVASTASIPLEAPAAVIEFAHSSEVVAERSQATDAIRNSPTWDQIKETIAELNQFEELPLRATQLLRDRSIRSSRENFYRTIGVMRGAIERGARAFIQPGTSSLNTYASARTSEVCWLNRTILTWADLRVLSELASDRSIEQLDLPRQLTAEVNIPGLPSKAPEFRLSSGRTGKGIIVAVIDSEVALQHPALVGRVIQKRNYSREPWGNPDAHGTTVAGIIAAQSDQYDGIAPNATIYNYKVLATNRFSNGNDFYGNLAIQSALEDGAHIANCSWGAGPISDGRSREARACNAAWQYGLTIVKSAGNNGPTAGSLTSPADAEGIIVVGATDETGVTVQDYSSRGPLKNGEHRPHLVAVGGTTLRGVDGCTVGGDFGDCGYGTSFAAPYITGLIALLLEGEPDLEPDQLRTKLLHLCNPLRAHSLDVDGEGFPLLPL